MQERYRKLSENMKGEKNPFYGKHHTIEARKKISVNAKGRVPTKETKHKISITLLGRKRPPFSDEWKQNISKGSQGKILSEEHKAKVIKPLFKYGVKNYFKEGHTPWNKGKKQWDTRIHPMLGKHPTEESKKKMSKSHIGLQAGKNHPSWKGGMYDKNRKKDEGRKNYRDWRRKVFERDNFTCIICQAVGGELNCHHIKPYVDYPKLRYDVNNGITLCADCHREVHKQDIDCLEYMEKVKVSKPVDKVFGY